MVPPARVQENTSPGPGEHSPEERTFRGHARPKSDKKLLDVSNCQELSSGALTVGLGWLVELALGAPPWKLFRTASKMAEP